MFDWNVLKRATLQFHMLGGGTSSKDLLVFSPDEVRWCDCNGCPDIKILRVHELKFCSREDRDSRNVKKTIQEPFRENKSKWLLQQLSLGCVWCCLLGSCCWPGLMQHFSWPRGATICASTTSLMCRRSWSWSVVLWVSGNHSCMWAYYKCMSSASLLLKIVSVTESKPIPWIVSQGHPQVSLLSFGPCTVQALLCCGRASRQLV